MRALRISSSHGRSLLVKRRRKGAGWRSMQGRIRQSVARLITSYDLYCVCLPMAAQLFYLAVLCMPSLAPPSA